MSTLTSEKKMRFGKSSSLRNFIRLMLLAGFGLSLATTNLGLSTSLAQEATLAELQTQWKELDAKLTAKETALEESVGDNTDEIQRDFNNLVSDANELIGKIEGAARSELKADSGNSNAIRALLGIMLNDAESGKDKKVLDAGDELIALGINNQYFEIASKSERLSIAAREIFDELIIRQAEALKNDLPRVKMKTTQGDIVLELFENEAPETVGNFISLVESGYYSDKLFHRVMEDFMAQTGGFVKGDDGEDKKQGPDYLIECECYKPDTRYHFTGSLSMAHAGRDTGAGQLFLTFRRTSHLDGKHTCFGRVIEGEKTLGMLERTHLSGPGGQDIPIPDVTKDKIISAEVLRKRPHRYRPNKVGVDEAAEDAAAAKKAAEEKAAAEAKAAEAKAAADAKAAEEKKMAEAAEAKAAADAEAKAAADKKAAEDKASEAKKAADKKADEPKKSDAKK